MKKMTGICMSTMLMASLILGACGSSETGGQPSESSGGSSVQENTSVQEGAGGETEDIVDITMAFFTAMEPNSDSLQAERTL